MYIFMENPPFLMGKSTISMAMFIQFLPRSRQKMAARAQLANLGPFLLWLQLESSGKTMAKTIEP